MKIYLLTDYKNRFNLKHHSNPYRSGMDIDLLKKYFIEYSYELIILQFSDIDFRNYNYKDKLVLYTSQEDVGGYYKSYIEDIIYGLHLQGAKLIPDFKYLRAHHNKVFMEFLRDQLEDESIKNIRSRHFGALEEVMKEADNFEYPVVVKGASGASSKNVALAKNYNELFKILKKIAPTRNYKEEFREFARKYKYKGYIKESRYRNKFIIQNFIPGLRNDWKIYLFGDKLFIFMRPIQPGRGFKASGGGYDNYFFGKNADFPEDILDYASKIFYKLDVPNVSLDIFFDENQFGLLEFQCICFGTAGILKKYSREYFIKKQKWIPMKNTGDIEKVYVDSIIEFLKNSNI